MRQGAEDGATGRTRLLHGLAVSREDLIGRGKRESRKRWTGSMMSLGQWSQNAGLELKRKAGGWGI